eukprot:TRINITY_DN3061_c0_g1_i1.p1 TRINITY_DN3061_c0_g1~~TRINITY_DN3061_c0_g1_i1.p1  ORF type:complete len:210 (-),score=26.45 TRINITY_DN3061_c0_g1_i1:261-890(-)
MVTIWYRAPELLLRSKHYTRAVDMWSIGCIFGELLQLSPLFRGHKTVEDQLECIFRLMGTPTVDEWPLGPELPDWESAVANSREKYRNNLQRHISQYTTGSAFDLLSRLLIYDPHRRITASEALDHQYFKDAPSPSQNAFFEVDSHKQYPVRSAPPDTQASSSQSRGATSQSRSTRGPSAAATSSASASASSSSKRPPSVGVGNKRRAR